MPKMKTKKTVLKRFKITKRGLVLHRSSGGRHLRSKKSKSRQRRQDAPQVLTKAKTIRNIRQLIQQ